MGNHFFPHGLVMDGSRKTIWLTFHLYRLSPLSHQSFCHTRHMGHGFGAQRQKEKLLQRSVYLHQWATVWHYVVRYHSSYQPPHTVGHIICHYPRVLPQCHKTLSRARLLQNHCRGSGKFQLSKLCHSRCHRRIRHGHSHHCHRHDICKIQNCS